ncbi:DUF5685 family protein [Nocardia sp. NPDC051030]|uniref:DUF5685 family protein n=1 Tax=Nocardia sp. NPDC051030 TaxID=3155162 RepID=UPI00343D076D
MFGLLKPCAHSAAKYGIDATTWQTHMCGLCLGLRDGHGQLARAATNTDALLLGVLTEAQQSGPAARATAGPCPLRGMRRAEVAPSNSPGVQLAATASLLLGAAKIRDHIEDGDTRRLAQRPLGRVSTRWHTRARAAATPIGLDIGPLIAAIESQAPLEHAVATRGLTTAVPSNAPDRTAPISAVGVDIRPDGLGGGAQDSSSGKWLSHSDPDALAQLDRRELLDALTAPTQLCAAELFAHTAVLADRPENLAALREAGWYFGRIAHLADAIEDLDDDRASGRFNPLAATGTAPEEAHSLLRESNSLLRAALVRAGLDATPTVRWMLLDPLSGVIRKLGRAAGVIHACTTRACGSRPSTVNHSTPNLETSAGEAGSTRWFKSVVPLNAVHTPSINGMHGVEPPRTPFRRPGFWEGIGIVATQYCTGYACCADHTRPCTGERKESWHKRDLCDCTDCCDCGDCCNCCSCGDCDCDCGCCDCSC